MWYTEVMARTDAKRNVILILSRDPAGAVATAFKGRAISLNSDGTLDTTAAAVTGATPDAVLLQLRQPRGASSDTPEGSAQFSPEEIFTVIDVPVSQLS
jgi:hypothetical protein